MTAHPELRPTFLSMPEVNQDLALLRDLMALSAAGTFPALTRFTPNWPPVSPVAAAAAPRLRLPPMILRKLL